MDIMFSQGSGEEEHMLCFVCVSTLGGEPLDIKKNGLWII